MHRPLISVIIPCYNGTRFVGDAIESALSQTYGNIEVIVVDDGSTDDSFDVIGTFGSAVRAVSIPHGGACRARNHGASLAHGDVLQFLDADDLLCAKKIEVQLAHMLQMGVDSVFCHAEVIALNGSKKPTVWQHSGDTDPVIAALGPNAGTPSGLHTRSAFWKIGGFRERLVAAQDRDFHLRLACNGHLTALVSQPLVVERRHDAGLSSDVLTVIRQYESIVVPAFHRITETGQISELRAQAFAGFMARAARMALKLQDIGLAYHLLSIGYRMHPSGGLEFAFGKPRALLWRFLGMSNAYKLTEFIRLLRARFTLGALE